MMGILELLSFILALIGPSFAIVGWHVWTRRTPEPPPKTHEQLWLESAERSLEIAPPANVAMRDRMLQWDKDFAASFGGKPYGPFLSELTPPIPANGGGQPSHEHPAQRQVDQYTNYLRQTLNSPTGSAYMAQVNIQRGAIQKWPFERHKDYLERQLAQELRANKQDLIDKEYQRLHAQYMASKLEKIFGDAANKTTDPESLFEALLLRDRHR